MSHFSMNFRRLLGLHDVSQQRAAELLGVSRTTVSNWISGEKEPSLSSLIKIQELFEVDPVKLAQASLPTLFDDLMDEGRFWRVEARVGDETTQAGLVQKVVPLKPEVRPS